MKICVLIPIFDHPTTIEKVVAGLPPDIPCLIVDDGSAQPTRDALQRVTAARASTTVVRRARNGGKGAALKTGYRAAAASGFTHVVQLDADAQHDTGDVSRFVAAIRAHPDALVLGVPEFDASAPLARIYARQLSRGLVWLACLSRAVPDPLCGFRGVPLAPALDGARIVADGRLDGLRARVRRATGVARNPDRDGADARDLPPRRRLPLQPRARLSAPGLGLSAPDRGHAAARAGSVEPGMTSDFPPIAELLPQAGAMRLLERVLGHDDGGTRCGVNPSQSPLFRDASGRVPVWIALEYMAQCAAADGSLRRRARGEEQLPALLIGSRRVTFHCAGFDPAQRLEVTARHAAGRRELLAFDCAVFDAPGGELLAEARLNVLPGLSGHTRFSA